MKICSRCRKEKYFNEFSIDKSRKDGYSYWCKFCVKQYRQKNKKILKQKSKQYYQKNKKYKKEYDKQYYQKNKKTIAKYNKQYYKNNSLYNTYNHQIEWCEETRRDPNNKNYLQVRCTEISCRRWFNPTNREIQDRIFAINSIDKGNSNLYCSKECKQNCTIYGQSKYPKGFNKYEKYRKEVMYLTNKNFHKYYWQINPKNLKRGFNNYHLDHIYSVAKGFKNNISPKIISMPENLQMLYWRENIKKGYK